MTGSVEPSAAAAREALIKAHMPYARTMAAMMYARRAHDDVEFADFLQWAQLGLIEAIDRFDPSTNSRFRSFAGPRIRGSVLTGLEHLTERQQQSAALRRWRVERVPSMHASDVASRAQLDNVFEALAQVGMGLALGFMLEDTGMLSRGEDDAEPDAAYRSTELRQIRSQLATLVKRLGVQERRVIDLHYFQRQPFEEVAHEMQLTKGRISQIHKRAVESLREQLSRRNPCDRAF